MAKKRPSALVIDRDGDSRQRVVALLRDAGFTVTDRVHSRDGLIALAQRRFDLAIIAGELRDGSDGLAAARRMQNWQNGIKVVVLTSAGATPIVASEDNLRLLAHPLDERWLNAAVLELMAPDAGGPAGRDAAELGVIEAQIACLFNRQAAAERSGSTYLARDIAHQIGDAMAARRNLQQVRSAAQTV